MVELRGPENKIRGSISLAGSKSISNRLLILKEILDLNINITNLSDSEDTVLLVDALQKIKNSQSATIDIHHAGTDMRFLTAFLSIKKGSWTLTGSERMRQRPIGPLVNALRGIGAAIKYLEKEDYPPLFIQGNDHLLNSVVLEADTSSQFLSALLLIAPAVSNGMKIQIQGQIVSRPYVEMTKEILRSFGIALTESDNIIRVEQFTGKPKIDSFVVESDWSAASYHYSICSLSPGSEIRLKHLHYMSLQGDSVLAEIYQDLGVSTSFENGSILLKNTELQTEHFSYDFSDCPDIAQTVAVTCFAHGISAHLTGLRTLKHKETDRISALRAELEKLGARVKVTPESLSLEVSTMIGGKPGKITTYDDHRMAMSFAPLALVYQNMSIECPNVVKKSYPRFWDDLLSLGFNVNLQP